MRILCMRHGHSGSGDGLADAARYLSARGRAEVRAVATALAQAGLKLDTVLTSPLVRAVQTAEITALALGFAGEVQALPALSYTESAREAADALASSATGTILAVGHMPTLPETVRALSGGRCAVALQTAQVLCIEDGLPRWTVSAQTGEFSPL